MSSVLVPNLFITLFLIYYTYSLYSCFKFWFVRVQLMKMCCNIFQGIYREVSFLLSFLYLSTTRNVLQFQLIGFLQRNTIQDNLIALIGTSGLYFIRSQFFVVHIISELSYGIPLKLIRSRTSIASLIGWLLR